MFIHQEHGKWCSYLDAYFDLPKLSLSQYLKYKGDAKTNKELKQTLLKMCVYTNIHVSLEKVV